MLVVDLGRKLDLLLPDVPRASMKIEIGRLFYRQKVRTPDTWFGDQPETERATVNINAPGPDNIIKYLLGVNVVFKKEWFALELDQFKAAIRKSEVDKGYAPGFDPIKMARALTGTYQIIRRYVDKPDKYILEPFVIDFDEELGSCEATGYSRNEVRYDHLYSGEVVVDEKWCFTLLIRPHKSVGTRRIGRAMLLQPNFRVKGDTMQIDDCFSGLMLRGVSARGTHQRGVGVPFVAIQIDNDPIRLSEISCDDIAEDCCVNLSKNLFIGELTKTQPEIYAFCKTIFSKLEFESINVLQSIAAERIVSVIRQAAGKQKSCRKLWEDIALTYVPPDTED